MELPQKISFTISMEALCGLNEHFKRAYNQQPKINATSIYWLEDYLRGMSTLQGFLVFSKYLRKQVRLCGISIYQNSILTPGKWNCV